MKKLINVLLKKEKFSKPPVWIMRQAGRYLPEYREIRSGVKNFLDLCYNPKLASEVTLQPIKRFDLDAAIIFSDILVIPDALGVKVDFVKGEGPKLERISTQEDLKKLNINNIQNHLSPVFETLKLTKSQLSDDKTLIGFSGSPWTLACYMIEGGSSKNFDLVKKTALQNEEFFSELIEILTKSIISYLSLKISAGADVVKLFDSWAGILPPNQLQKFVINPNKKIVEELRKLHPETPIICFPRGIGTEYGNFVEAVKPNAVAFDQNISAKWIKNNIQNKYNAVVQGNLDNFLLAFGKEDEIKRAVFDILENLSEENFIFNLGHGILPQTPIKNVELILKLIGR